MWFVPERFPEVEDEICVLSPRCVCVCKWAGVTALRGGSVVSRFRGN